MSKCRSCGAEIVWGFTRNAKRMPVDPDPSPKGNIVLTAGNDGPELVVLPADEVERRRGLGLPLHTSHFQTCPNAAAHRRP